MENWSCIDYFEKDNYMFFYCPHCKKVYYIEECRHTIDDQRDSVNYYKEYLDCKHCYGEVECVFTDEDDLQQWLEDLLNNGDELPLNIKVKTEKDHYEDDELIKVEYWDWKK